MTGCAGVGLPAFYPHLPRTDAEGSRPLPLLAQAVFGSLPPEAAPSWTDRRRTADGWAPEIFLPVRINVHLGRGELIMDGSRPSAGESLAFAWRI